MEEDEDDALESLDEMKVESWIREANLELRSRFRFELPVQLGPPKRSVNTVKWGTRGTEIPIGALFYPSCGRDLSDAVAHFAEAADSLHFADAYISPFRSRVGVASTTEVVHVGNVVSMEPEERELDVNGSAV